MSAKLRWPLRILIADDDRDTANTLAALMRDEGHDVKVVLRGDEVLEVERLLRPDVLIVDINMPGMSGYAIARELREQRGVATPLLIAISGVWTRTSERPLGDVVGFDHYLLKPCDPGEITAITSSYAQRGAPPPRTPES
ncbi:MAG TPA: response regulator [Burkholderiales bacterium]|nr:response regulator [Burkholderiales bacterium]